MFLGHCLQVVPRGPTSPPYRLYVHSGPFPRPSRLPAPGPLGYSLLGI
jgi:hypothetical protein